MPISTTARRRQSRQVARSWLLWLAWLGSVHLAACGPQDDLSLREAIEPIVRATCDWSFECCSMNERAFALGPFTETRSDCVDRTIAALEAGNESVPTAPDTLPELALLAHSLRLGRISFSRGAVDDCATSVREGPCNPPPPDEPKASCVPGEAELESQLCTVERLVVGRQQVGEECNPAVTFECETGLRCTDFGTIGVCARSSQEGEFCFADQDCRNDLFCDVESGSCARAAPVGESCRYVNPGNPLPGTELVRCEPGLTCDPSTLRCVAGCAPGSLCQEDPECPDGFVCAVGRCREPGTGGEPCARAEDCASLLCDGGTLTCVAIKPLGGDCFDHSGCTTGFCDPFTSTCARGQVAGQPCPSLDSAQCIAGWCDPSSGVPVCGDFAPEGGACIAPAACGPGDVACTGGVCRVVPLANGVPCNSNTQCESLLCWAGVCSPGTSLGFECDSGQLIEPCVRHGFCLYQAVGATCAARFESGIRCDTSEQCWGGCIDAWGQRMCDATAADGSSFCDGEHASG